MLPHDLPFRANGLLLLPTLASGWNLGTDALDACEQKCVSPEGRNVEPSAASADTQSVKTAGPAIESGYDGGKNVSGRKRHILVDTLGLLLTVFVHDAHRDHIAGFQLLCSWG